LTDRREIEELIGQLEAAAQRLGEPEIGPGEAAQLVADCASIAGRLATAFEELVPETPPPAQPPLAGPTQEPLL
jgi:hypothetical protein